jgi:hypothetical protein
MGRPVRAAAVIAALDRGENIESKKVHDAERFRNDAPQRQRTGADEHSEEAEARLEYFADNRASHPFRDACD